MTRAMTRARPSVLARVGQSLRSFWRGPYDSRDPALAKLFGEGYQSASGVHVTRENAFTFSAVFDAVNQLSSDTAKLPLNLRKRRQDGGSDLYTDSRLYRMLKYEPNPEMGSMVFRRTLIAHALTCHGGYAEIERDGTDKPKNLWILTPDRVEPIRRPYYDSALLRHRLGPLQYRIDGDDNTILDAKNVIHIHGLGYDGYLGYSIIDKARQAIGLALAAESFGATYFGKGTVFGGWLKTDEDLDEPQKIEIRDSITAFRNAQDSAFRILITEKGREFHQFTSKPADSQMDELRVRQVEEVARFFRLPPHKLGVNTPGTVSYASVEAAQLDYYVGPLLDWITLVEQEFQRKLISPLEQNQQFIKHNVDALLRGTIAERYAALGVARDKGIINADEWRDLEDMNPQPNGQGQVYLVQSAQIPVDLLPAYVQAQIDKTQKEAKPDPAPVAPAPTPDTTPTQAQADEANARAARAEALAREAQAHAAEAREALAVAVTTGTVKADELLALRVSLEKSQELATQLLLASEQSRERADALQAAKDTATTDLLAERTARSEADAARVVAEQQAEELRRISDEATASAATAQIAADAAKAESEQAKAGAVTARAEVAAAVERATVAGADAVAQAEARIEAERKAEAAELLAKSAGAEGERLQAELEAANARDVQAAEALRAAEARVAAVTAEAVAEAERLAREVAERLESELAQARTRQAEMDAAKERESRATEALLEAQHQAVEASLREMNESALRAAADAKAATLAVAVTDSAREREAAERRAAEAETKALEAAASAQREAAARAEAERAAVSAREEHQSAMRVLESASGEAQSTKAAAEQRAADAERNALEALANAKASAEERADAMLLAEAARAELELAKTVSDEAKRAAVEAAQSLSETLSKLTEREAVITERDFACQQMKDQIAALETALSQTRGDHESTLTGLRDGLALMERERDTMRAELSAAEARATVEAAARVELQARHAAAIVSQRSEVADIMRRMIARETERARRAQTTPSKLRAHAETFYPEHSELCQRALERAVNVHLQLVGSTDDPHDVTAAIVKDHVAQSVADLRTVADVDPVDFQATLHDVLDRWERVRPDVLADRLMREEIGHARN